MSLLFQIRRLHAVRFYDFEAKDKIEAAGWL
jgi:hypothetical protein